SPGISRIRMNTSAAAPTSVGITSSTRLVTYWYIPSSHSLFVVQAPRAPLPDGTRTTRVRSTVRRLIQPDIGEILVDIVARTDLPAVHVGAFRDLAVPPDHRELPRLGVDDAGFVLPHQRSLLGEVGLAQHPVV